MEAGGNLQNKRMEINGPKERTGVLESNECVWEHDCGTPDDKRCRAVTVSDSYTTTVARDIADSINSITGGSYLYLEELTFSF